MIATDRETTAGRPMHESSQVFEGLAGGGAGIGENADGLARATVRQARMAWLALFLAAMAGSVLATPGESPARFSLDGALRALKVSTCGRYSLDAMVQHTPEAKSADGRYALKAVHVPEGGCDPFPDPLFSDGFEP